MIFDKGTFVLKPEDIFSFRVTDNYSRKTVREVAESEMAKLPAGKFSLVMNADSYPKTAFRSNGYWVADGQIRNHEWRDYTGAIAANRQQDMFYWRKMDNDPRYYPPTSNPLVYNCFSLTRQAILDGRRNPRTSNGGINNWCGWGFTANRELVYTWFDGWDIHHTGIDPKGVTMYEGIDKLLMHNVMWGGDGDYGDGLYVAWNGDIINDWYNDGNPEKPCVNHAVFILNSPFSEVFKGELLPEPPEPPEPPVEPPTEEEVTKVTIEFTNGRTQVFR